MSSTICIFTPSKAECKGAPMKNLTMLMCEKHLRDYYGLELGYVEFDNITHYTYVGYFLKPVRDVAIFQRNTVIIPTKMFFDKYFRSMDFQAFTKDFKPEQLVNLDDTKNFNMNPRISEIVRNYAKNAPKSPDQRHVIEMYRNFLDDNTDVGPLQQDELIRFQALINVKKVASKTMIDLQPSKKILGDNTIYDSEDDKPKVITEMNWSVHMQYLMSNCLYSEFQVSHNKLMFSDYLQFNVKYVRNIGLVATEQIAHPLFLVLDGRTIGSQIYLNAHVTPLEKIIQKANYQLKDLPKPFVLNEVFKSGVNC